MSRIKFEAKDYVNYLSSEGKILSLVHYSGSDPDGRGRALIINEIDRVAVMLEDCGDPKETGIRAGYLVNYMKHPEGGETKIVGTPGKIRE